MKKLKLLFITLVAVISLLLPYNNTHALATVEGWWGYSMSKPHAHYFFNYPYNYDTWAQGEYFFDQFAFDGSYAGTQIYKVNINGVSNDDVNITGYAHGRQVAYFITKNCIPNNSTETVGNHWVLESVNSQTINYIDNTAYVTTDNGVRTLWQMVYRNDTDDTTIPGHIPVGMWCTSYQGASATRDKPMINLATVGIYGPQPFIDYTQQLEEIKDAIENGSDAGEVLQQQREEDKQDMQDAQGDASTDGADSQSQATGQGQTLLQAFISFVQAITSASPGNCNLDMDTGFIDFGTVNLCSLNPPPAFQVISSIVVIGFAVPLSINASKKMIELFRSFQT